ncbi:ABC transporter substrate-binding protein [uncultured Gemmiger sp.]|uniref:ABC transporter substrate-binding protein n=1 Tax=uncultured Gemmiger sp. TaxID=1623490 RepID=UPI0025F2B1C4|nr:ABC transporter substrate-binding protein [uncultured Gemmiger sp.]
MRKFCAVLAVLFCLSFLLAGCSRPAESPTGGESSGVIDPSVMRYAFRADAAESEALTEPYRFQQQFFLQDDAVVKLSFSAQDGRILDVTDAADGSAVAVPDTSLIQEQFESGSILCGAYWRDGQLWLLSQDPAANEYTLYPTEKDAQTLGECPFQYAFTDKMAVWQNYVLLMGQDEADSLADTLVLYDTQAQTEKKFANVSDFALDSAGNLYYIQCTSAAPLLVKYNLEEKKTHWQRESDSELAPQKVFCSGKDELFVCSSTIGAQGSIYALDPTSGVTLYKLFDWGAESPDDYTQNKMARADFAVGADYTVWFDNLRQAEKTLWRFTPYLPDAAAAVTLTITAPYKEEALDAAARRFSKAHPDVQFSWDTDYKSADDYLHHSEQYAEKINLRLMTGDIGDLFLLPGKLSGQYLDGKGILNAGSLAPLDDCLSGCPDLDALDTVMLAPLRDETGTLRAIPLGVNPQYLIYNQTLGEQLGLTWDTDSLTWTQIFDLGMRWKDENAPYTLFACMSAYAVNETVGAFLLDSTRDIAAMQPDLEKLNTLLSEKTHLYRIPENASYYWSKGFFDNALFCYGQGASYEDTFERLSTAESENGITLKILPMPTACKYRQSYADCLGISTASDQKDYAEQFVQYLLGTGAFTQNIYTTESALMNREADFARFSSAEMHTFPLQERHYQQYRAVCTLPADAYLAPFGWDDAMWPAFRAYRSGNLTLEECVAQMQAKFKMVE